MCRLPYTKRWIIISSGVWGGFRKRVLGKEGIEKPAE